MRRTALSAFALLPLLTLCGNCPSVFAEPTSAVLVRVSPDTEVISETFFLNFASPSAVISLITQPGQSGAASRLMPAGISAMTPDETAKTLSVIGTRRGIAQIRDRVRLLDVEPKTMRLDIRVLRYDPIQGKAEVAEAVASGTAKARNNEPVDIVTFGKERSFHVHILPHVNGDGSVSVQASLSSALYVSEVKDQNRRIESGPALFVPAAGSGGVYCLEIKPTVLPSPAAQASGIPWKTTCGDKEPSVVEVKLQLIQYQVTADGKVTREILQQPRISTVADQEGMVTIAQGGESTAIHVTPHINGDRSISLEVKYKRDKKGVSAVGVETSRQDSLSVSRRVQPGMTAHIDWLPDKLGEQGAVLAPKDSLNATGKPYTALGLNISASVLPDTAAVKP